MSHGILGRANRAFPPVWLSLSVPRTPEDIAPLAEFALASGVPLDVTASPGLWSGYLRGHEAFVTAIGNAQYENATDETHATDLVQANLIEILSNLGRETVDIYWLRVRRAVEEYQIWGALQALDAARQDGHIRFIGLCVDGPGLAALGLWQFHDAFDLLLVPRNHDDRSAYDTLKPIADDRRVGIVTSRPFAWSDGLPFFDLPDLWRLRNLAKSSTGMSLPEAVVADLSQDHPLMVGVRTAEEARLALGAYDKGAPVGLAAYLEEFRTAWHDPATWTRLAQSDDRTLRDAARRRIRREGLA